MLLRPCARERPELRCAVTSLVAAVKSRIRTWRRGKTNAKMCARQLEKVEAGKEGECIERMG